MCRARVGLFVRCTYAHGFDPMCSVSRCCCYYRLRAQYGAGETQLVSATIPLAQRV